jgi:hypothetical protein
MRKTCVQSEFGTHVWNREKSCANRRGSALWLYINTSTALATLRLFIHTPILYLQENNSNTADENCAFFEKVIANQNVCLLSFHRCSKQQEHDHEETCAFLKTLNRHRVYLHLASS